jgi:hypothetical protein
MFESVFIQPHGVEQQNKESRGKNPQKALNLSSLAAYVTSR